MALDRLVRPPGLAAAAAVQVAGLVAWLGLVRSHPASSPAGLLGVAALASGLFLGVLFTHVSVRGRGRRLPLVRSLALGLAEAGLWVGWLAVARLFGGGVGIAAASAALAVGYVPHRLAEANLLGGHPALDGQIGPATLSAGGVAGLGAVAWLSFVGYGPFLLDLLGASDAVRAGVLAIGSAPASAPAAGLLDPPRAVGLVALAVATLLCRVLVVRVAGR